MGIVFSCANIEADFEKTIFNVRVGVIVLQNLEKENGVHVVATNLEGARDAWIDSSVFTETQYHW